MAGNSTYDDKPEGLNLNVVCSQMRQPPPNAQFNHSALPPTANGLWLPSIWFLQHANTFPLSSPASSANVCCFMSGNPTTICLTVLLIPSTINEIDTSSFCGK